MGDTEYVWCQYLSILPELNKNYSRIVDLWADQLVSFFYLIQKLKLLEQMSLMLKINTKWWMFLLKDGSSYVSSNAEDWSTMLGKYKLPIFYFIKSLESQPTILLPIMPIKLVIFNLKTIWCITFALKMMNSHRELRIALLSLCLNLLLMYFCILINLENTGNPYKSH
jgi:hypothetical protein